MPDIKNDEKPRLNGTTLIHGDAAVNGHKDEIAPPISVTATFKAAPDDSLGDSGSYWNPKAHVYSRYTRDTTTRVEHILSAVNRGHAITYGSGLSAGYAALVHFKPKRIAIRGGYMGFHETIAMYNKSRDTPVVLFDIDEEFREGDLCWIESPINPRGESKDIKYYAEKIHKVGGVLAVDSTFGPPPLQFPLDLGADCVLHSATKYFGGHSDLLCGILVVKTREVWDELQHTRTYLGSIPGSLESWLLLRSLRTLHLRVPRQSETATRIVQWLNALAKTPAGAEFDGVPGGLLTTVFHSSVQGVDERGFDAGKQMTGGWNPTFSIMLATPDLAKRLPFALKYFVAATSLGGVESLVEYRLRADPKEHPCLVRLSIGVEEYEDLKDDLKQGLLALVAKAKL